MMDDGCCWLLVVGCWLLVDWKVFLGGIELFCGVEDLAKVKIGSEDW